jgi:hypothetical protein
MTKRKPKPLELFTPRRRLRFEQDYEMAEVPTKVLSRSGTINGEEVVFFRHEEEHRTEVWFYWQGILYGANHVLIHALVRASVGHANGLLHLELPETAP